MLDLVIGGLQVSFFLVSIVVMNYNYAQIHQISPTVERNDYQGSQLAPIMDIFLQINHTDNDWDFDF